MNDSILLSHGNGGKLAHELTEQLFVRYFNNDALNALTDSAILKLGANSISFTTDSYVVNPVFFPGGDIGKLAVCGTVNDLAVSGAEPLYLSCGFIIEEGFLLKDLERIVKSMKLQAEIAGVKIVTGDTKVVDKGKADKIFINTSGIGQLNKKYISISTGSEIKPGDKIIINGYIGDHGTSILCARNNLDYHPLIESDCAPLNHLIKKALKIGKIKFMRDATRGGLATVLCELAEKSSFGVEIDEQNIPVRENVRGICEVFGFDPLYMANEGKVIMVVSPEDADNIIEIMKMNEYGKNTEVIGRITSANKGRVIMNTRIGGRRIIDMLTGEQLPRIC
jgi:hydrogenase expression/formation protein HypE